MNKNLKERAITLIALVITIVVLIILAGVAINLSLGENGLFKKAKTASEEYSNAQRTEETEIAYLEYQVDMNSRETITIPKEEYTRLLNSSNANNYSTVEQVVGSWINGKPLYQKTIETTYASTNETWKNEAHNIPNIDHVIDIRGYINNDVFQDMPLNSVINSSPSMWYTGVDKTNINTYSNYVRVLGRPMIITIQYTKTTD